MSVPATSESFHGSSTSFVTTPATHSLRLALGAGCPISNVRAGVIVGVLANFAAATTLMLIGDNSLCVLELAAGCKLIAILAAMAVYISAAALGAFVFRLDTFVELAMFATFAVTLIVPVVAAVVLVVVAVAPAASVFVAAVLAVVAVVLVGAVAILPPKAVVAGGAVACVRIGAI